MAFIIITSSGRALFMYYRGGSNIAESMGGRRVLLSSENKKDKILIHVVEEVSIASGVIAPKIYVLDEPGINAFASGFSREDSIIAVTRGALENLSRDELQGVVAHEFSHIFNGDMRLNMYASALIFGFVSIIVLGRAFLKMTIYSGDSGKGKIAGIGISLIIMLIGSIGWVGGYILQAALSRKREYLADATAVQYTRNPHGIAGALIKIGNLKKSSKVDAAEAGCHAHMFFSNIYGTSSLFSSLTATHPPLNKRIEAITGQKYNNSVAVNNTKIDNKNAMVSGIGGNMSEVVDSTETNSAHIESSEYVNHALKIRNEIPKKIIPHSLKKSVYIAYAIASGHKDIKSEWRLVLIDLIVPYLRELSPDDYKNFRATLTDKISKYNKQFGMISRNGFMLTEILIKQLDLDHGMRNRIIQNVSNIDGKYIGVLLKFASDSEEAYNKGKQALSGISISTRDSYTISASILHDALTRISKLNLKMRTQIINACVSVVLYDKVVTINEAESLRAIATSMDVAIPEIGLN